jgi:hypothetical protein
MFSKLNKILRVFYKKFTTKDRWDVKFIDISNIFMWLKSTANFA